MFKIITAVCPSAFSRKIKQTKVGIAHREKSARLALISIISFKDRVFIAMIFYKWSYRTNEIYFDIAVYLVYT